MEYTNPVAVTWSRSAAKHGIAREDAMHAIGNAVYVELSFDEPRPPNAIRPHLYIGPQRDPSAPLLEVMVEVRPSGGLQIFHVMPARSKHLARITKKEPTHD